MNAFQSFKLQVGDFQLSIDKGLFREITLIEARY